MDVLIGHDKRFKLKGLQNRTVYFNTKHKQMHKNSIDNIYTKYIKMTASVNV